MSLRHLPAALAIAIGLTAAPAAHAAKSCAEPTNAADGWQRATPAEAGMDGAKLQSGIDYGSTQASYAIRVYRHGCLVGEDRLADQNRHSLYESFSMAKSVTTLTYGRAMTLGLISPSDPVGSLVPEADKAHGQITVHDLLTMTSGLHWNGFRDYNVFTMPDTVRDALTVGVAHKPGTYFEYAQTPVALLAEMVGRSTGQDTMAFAQRELMTALGIEAGSWEWGRDKAGHVQGFSGVRMTPDDYGRLGDLMRRGGVWRGTRLLSREFVRRAITPSQTNGCYGWLIWLNAAQPCISPTVAKRPVKNSRDFPDLPADFYSFSGLFGQRVTMFPTQDVVIVRTGQDPSLVPAGQSSWEHELYTRVLGAITDGKWKAPGDAPRVNEERKDVDYGFGSSAGEPGEYSKGFVQDDLPPAGPARARAAILTLARALVDRQGIVRLTIACPARTAKPCSGTARLTDTKAKRYDVAGGRAETLSFRLSQTARATLRERGRLVLTATAMNADAAGGTATTSTFTVRG